MNHTALYDAKLERGARFVSEDGHEIAVDYGNPIAEHNAVRASVGLLDRSFRGKLVLTGDDRVSWLQGMVSNDVRAIEAGAPRLQACMLNATGHLLVDVAIVRRPDSLLLDMPSERVADMYELLNRYIISEDVEIVDQTDYLACLSLQGPKVDRERARLQAGEGATIAPADHTGEGGVDIYLKATEAPALWRALVDAGAVPAGREAAETLRIEAGIPRYGVDMDENTLPLECNLEATHISYEKGCYIGQEIVARLHSRGHTNRTLVGLVLEGAVLPLKGDHIYPGEGPLEKPVGWATSAAHSPSLERSIALGYVRHEFAAPDTPVRIAREDHLIHATVRSLPLYRKA